MVYPYDMISLGNESEWSADIWYNRMGPEKRMLSERSHHRRPHIAWFHHMKSPV